MARHMALIQSTAVARLAQLVERKAFNLVVVGSSPTVGGFRFVIEKQWSNNQISVYGS